MNKSPMTVFWVDTETTGMKPVNSAPFEIAILVYQDRAMPDGKVSHQFVEEKVFQLNPLDDEVLYHADAFETHGVAEETIRGFRPAAEAVPEIVALMKNYCYNPEDEKLIFAGYNCPFDYSHLSGLLFRHGGNMMGDYFSGRLIDVYEKVKRSAALLPKTKNQRLETMCKALGIPHENRHSALGDIHATRRLYEAIYILSTRRK
jgi:DNA polymerase III epsilon subunit-like protein